MWKINKRNNNNFAQKRKEKKNTLKAPQRAQRFTLSIAKLKSYSFDSIESFAADVKQFSVRDFFRKYL